MKSYMAGNFVLLMCCFPVLSVFGPARFTVKDFSVLLWVIVGVVTVRRGGS